MKIAVVTDSGTGWTMEQARALGLYYLPLQVKCGDEEFLDGVDLTVSELYARLKRGEMPTTSMPPVGKVEALFEELKQEQIDHVIAVPLTSGISSTAEMIQAAAHRAEMSLTLIDPYTTVNIQGYLALCAHQLAQQADGHQADQQGGHGGEHRADGKLGQGVSKQGREIRHGGASFDSG